MDKGKDNSIYLKVVTMRGLTLTEAKKVNK